MPQHGIDVFGRRICNKNLRETPRPLPVFFVNPYFYAFILPTRFSSVLTNIANICIVSMKNRMMMMTAEEAAEAARGLTFEKVWAMFQETAQRQEETGRLIEELSKNIGGLNNSFGRWAEEIVSAKIRVPEQGGEVY
jgi:hypothetical protein